MTSKTTGGADCLLACLGATNGSFKAELIEHQGPWRDADQVERAVVQWVAWYDTERLHSALDCLPPEEFEAQHYRSQATTNAA
ncbi:integrase core domain-containing protein [Streptomyces sp. NBC_01669]|uniref:integrase core domain-containing protein n=1 Tax=Streptomyces sp. NBC_01669 TaxID=2975909 RepID=UPI002254BDF4|nr:integrase core domain-containing protein [Streptomyces sp. NBC_01669]MCX4538893.1 integrase core domain-containing protein [Streptomyces sp. NBC_01669]